MLCLLFVLCLVCVELPFSFLSSFTDLTIGETAEDYSGWLVSHCGSGFWWVHSGTRHIPRQAESKQSRSIGLRRNTKACKADIEEEHFRDAQRSISQKVADRKYHDKHIDGLVQQFLQKGVDAKIDVGNFQVQVQQEYIARKTTQGKTPLQKRIEKHEAKSMNRVALAQETESSSG